MASAVLLYARRMSKAWHMVAVWLVFIAFFFFIYVASLRHQLGAALAVMPETSRPPSAI